MPLYPMPFVRVEIALQSVVDRRLCTLFVMREQPPYAGRWALPGGIVRVDLDANLDAAAIRMAQERLGSAPPNLQQLCAVGAAGREPRGPQKWGLSVVYRTLVPEGSLTVTPGKRVSGLKWVPADEPLTDARVGFDHQELAARAIAATRSEIAALKFPPGFVPARFTLTELQQLCEQVLGSALDKSSFRRKLRERGLTTPVEGMYKRGERSRPAAFYSLSGSEASDRT